MEKLDHLEFSQEQKLVTGFFYNNSHNGIIVFTEDSNNEHEFYVKFFNRLLKDTDVTVDKVIPLGSCDKVQQTYNNDSDYSFPKLYVMDGDIYLQYAPKKSHDRLYVLDRYCIENYLIDEKTLCSVIQRFYPKPLEKIKEDLSYNTYMQAFAEHFIIIYFYYAMLSEENKKVKKTKTACFTHRKFSDFYLTSSNTYIKSNIDSFIRSSEDELCKLPNIDKTIISNKIKEKENRFPFRIETALSIISAKDDIFPFLIKIISKQFHIQEKSLFVWKFNCADFYDTEPLEPLKSTIVSIFNQWNNNKHKALSKKINIVANIKKKIKSLINHIICCKSN